MLTQVHLVNNTSLYIVAIDTVDIPKLSGFIGMIELVLTNTGISDRVNFLLISTFPFTHSPVDQQTKVPY